MRYSDFLHYTLNTSDAAFITHRDSVEANLIRDFVTGWNTGHMVKESLPQSFTDRVDSCEGISIVHSKCTQGWIFDIVATGTIIPIIANQLLKSQDECTSALFELTNLMGGINLLPIDRVQYPALLTSLNTMYMNGVGLQYGLRAGTAIYQNFAKLEQCIAEALIERGF